MNAMQSIARGRAYACVLAVIAGSWCLELQATPPACDSKRVDPWPYPIVIRGPAALEGARTKDLEGYRFTGRKWVSMPIQIDEVNRNNEYVLDNGLPYTVGSDDGMFDSNDEIVLDGAQLGLYFSEQMIPRWMRGRAVKLWRVSFCGEGGRGGTGLILEAATNALPRPIDPPGDSKGTAQQVTFDRRAATIETEQYRYVFNAENPALLGSVYLRDSVGAETLAFMNARFKMPLVMPWYLPNFTVGDEMFAAHIESWQSGPLRSIVAVGVKFKNFLSLLKLHLFSELIFYRNRFQIPTVIEFVFSPKEKLKAGSGIAYAMSFPDGAPWVIESNLVPLPPAPGDVATLQPVVVDDPRNEEFAATARSSAGAAQIRVHVDSRVRAVAHPPFIMRRDTFHDSVMQKNWSFLRGMDGDLGLYLDFSGIDQGTYAFGLNILLSRQQSFVFPNVADPSPSWQQIDNIHLK